MWVFLDQEGPEHVRVEPPCMQGGRLQARGQPVIGPALGLSRLVELICFLSPLTTPPRKYTHAGPRGGGLGLGSLHDDGGCARQDLGRERGRHYGGLPRGERDTVRVCVCAYVVYGALVRLGVGWLASCHHLDDSLWTCLLGAWAQVGMDLTIGVVACNACIGGSTLCTHKSLK